MRYREYLSGLSDGWFYLLGYYLGDGYVTEDCGEFWICGSQNDLERLSEELKGLGFEFSPYWYSERAWKYKLPDIAQEFLTRMGLVGVRSRDRFVPREIIGVAPTQRIKVRRFLEGLFDADGNAYISPHARRGSITLSTRSLALQEGVSLLLKGLGIEVSCRKHSKRDELIVGVLKNSYKKFSDQVKLGGKKRVASLQLASLTGEGK